MGTVNTLNGDWQNVSFDDHKRSIRLKDAHAPVNGFRIALVGESGSGKNALANGILHYHADAISMGFADELKFMVSDMINYAAVKHDLKHVHYSAWNLEQLESAKGELRTIWQTLGTDIIRARYPYYWVNRLAMRLNQNPFGSRVVITDCRFENEAQWARENGFLLARIVGRKGGAPVHESEQHVNSIDVDFQYNNAGTLDDLVEWGVKVLVPAAQQIAYGRRSPQNK